MRALSVWPCALVLACGTVEVSSDAGTSSDSSSSTTGDDESDTGTPTDDEPPTLPSCPSERSEIDRPDDSPLPQVRVLYVIPADFEDEALDTNDRICNSVRAWTQWLIDVMTCPRCRGAMKLIDIANEREAIARALANAGLASRPPPRSRPSLPGQLDLKFAA